MVARTAAAVRQQKVYGLPTGRPDTSLPLFVRALTPCKSACRDVVLPSMEGEVSGAMGGYFMYIRLYICWYKKADLVLLAP
jgi:hypothetical protein